MSKIETDAHALNLIISNITNFSSKAERLLVGKSKNFPDFFDQYREYLIYLKSLDFETNSVTDLIKNGPKIPASGFSLRKLLIILPFFLYLFVIQIYLLLFIWVPIILAVAIYFFINEKRKHKMAEIMIFNSKLIDLLQEKIN